MSPSRASNACERVDLRVVGVTTATPSSRRSSRTNAGLSAMHRTVAGSAAGALQHLVGGRPGIGRALDHSLLEAIPTLAGAQLPGPPLEAAGDDLAQLLPDPEVAAALELTVGGDDLAVVLHGLPEQVDAIPVDPTVGMIGGRQESWPRSDRSSICSSRSGSGRRRGGRPC